jgi:hypothetical protein
MPKDAYLEGGGIEQYEVIILLNTESPREVIV